MRNKESIRILFAGTPEFAVPSLGVLVRNGFNIVGVLAAPDKPSGRGLTLNLGAVKNFAVENHLPVFQPVKLDDEQFLAELQKLKPDLMVVVAFRKMPESVWSIPPLGTFNLHASLLPQYRGAAPINRAIMNGETETGITTFFIGNVIDTGQILFREPFAIGPDENAGSLHDRLSHAGAMLVLKTVESIISGTYTLTKQEQFMKPGESLMPAPKILKADCRIQWNKPVGDIHNQVRGLSPVPGAFTNLLSPEGKSFSIKILESSPETGNSQSPGQVQTDSKNYLKITGNKGMLRIQKVQLAGKKVMPIEDFLRGFPMNEHWHVEIN